MRAVLNIHVVRRRRDDEINRVRGNAVGGQDVGVVDAQTIIDVICFVFQR